MSKLKNIANRIVRVLEENGKNRARMELLRMGDANFLREVGISVEALNQGVEAWPWRIESAEVTSIRQTNNDSAVEAVASLSKVA